MTSSNVLILIPILNDWQNASLLLNDLDDALELSRQHARVLFVDDGSSDLIPMELGATRRRRLDDIAILRLRRNVGHQRAIAIGLAYVEAHIEADAVVVMDADGEDRPTDVVRLIDEMEERRGQEVIFAERTRRSEGGLFTFGYGAYRAVHFLLTGERVRVGNFSVVPFQAVRRLVASSDLWNHYAAAVFKSRIPYRTIQTTRGKRYVGQSHMSYVALVTHGLSAMSVFGERIGVRLIAATLASAAGLVLIGLTILSFHALTGATLPTWAGYVLAILAVAVFQAISISLSFVFIVLAGRDSSTFLPLRDYAYFVGDVFSVYGAPV
jgi:hypothetical protein